VVLPHECDETIFHIGTRCVQDVPSPLALQEVAAPGPRRNSGFRPVG
jgi:hypothetical protein